MQKVKPFLFMCGGLMAAATFIGAFDYSQSSISGKLKDLYKDEALASHVVPIINKKIDIEDYSRAAIERETYKEPTTNVVLNAGYNEKKALKHKVVKRKAAGKKYSGTSRKLRPEDFSRAPIRIPTEENMIEVGDSVVVVNQ